jgi:hypothetical protein
MTQPRRVNSTNTREFSVLMFIKIVFPFGKVLQSFILFSRLARPCAVVLIYLNKANVTKHVNLSYAAVSVGLFL